MHFWAPEIDPSHPMDCTQALRAANELNRGGRGPIDVVKIEWEPV